MRHLLCEVSVLLVLAADVWSVSLVPREIMADDPDANGQRTARFLGLGYNILKADPEAKGYGGVDPGFLTSHRVVDVTSAGEETFSRSSCVPQTSTSLVYDEQSFQRKYDREFKFELGVSAELISARFGMSTSFSEARDETTKEKKISLETWSVCNLGGARMKTELDENRASQGFQAAVCSLPDTYDEDAYVRFIDTWGTSVVTGVEMGIRDITKKTETFSTFYNSLQKSLGLKQSASMTYDLFFTLADASIEINMHSLDRPDKLNETFKGVETRKTIGTLEFPEPIQITVDSIHTVVTAAYFGSTNPKACNATKMSQLALKQANLKRVLDRYPVIKGVNITSSSEKVKIPLAWPRGTYGLFKPKTACPAGWNSDGFRDWDSDGNPHNSVTSGHHFDGSIGDDIGLKFCIKSTPVTEALTDVEWPVGEYCLLKYRACPPGLKQGSIHWNDEDDNNQNHAGGTLPDGTYGVDTDIQFCCQKDGISRIPIFLPTDTPFYLMQGNRYGCQTVAGMQVRQESILWDTENYYRLTGDYEGSIPLSYLAQGEVAIYFCYYYK